MNPMTIQGRRLGWIAQALLLAPFAILIGLLGATNLNSGKIWAGAAYMIVGLFEIACIGCLVGQAMKPNQLILSDAGIALRTIYGNRNWIWADYLGLTGGPYYLLKVRKTSVKSKLVPIGHWRRGLTRTIRDYASDVGVMVPPMPVE